MAQFTLPKNSQLKKGLHWKAPADKMGESGKTRAWISNRVQARSQL